MPAPLPIVLAAAGLTLVPTPSMAEQLEPPERSGHSATQHGPHHISILVAGTDIDAENETAFTLGLDYEYRVNKLLGLGFVAEQASGEIDSTTVLAVADIHITKRLIAQIGPGVEFIDGTEYLVGRLGALYEFDLGDQFTLSPQLHYDASEGEDAIVFGVAFGRSF